MFAGAAALSGAEGPGGCSARHVGREPEIGARRVPPRVPDPGKRSESSRSHREQHRR